MIMGAPRLAGNVRFDTIAVQWMDLLRLRHAETFRHCARVALLGERMASVYRMDADECMSLIRGCFLHDLGKIMVPVEILDASAPLSQEQWETMKLHSRHGYELLKDAGLGDQVPQIVLHHHERWDGKGYPDGIGGEDIPFHARICAVIDAFDSMMSNRPYRRRKSIWEAAEELKRHSGRQFDARIVERFSGILQEAGKIYDLPE